MSTEVNQRKRLWRWPSSEGKTRLRLKMRSAVAEVREVETALEVIVLSKGLGYEVKLVHVSRGTPPEFRSESAADILCLDLHDFGLSETIAWVRAATNISPECPPCIAVLGSEDELNREDLWRISVELEPAGAIFHTWPKECGSFNEAFKALGNEISKTYGRRISQDEGIIDERRNYGVLVDMSKA